MVAQTNRHIVVCRPSDNCSRCRVVAQDSRQIVVCRPSWRSSLLTCACSASRAAARGLDGMAWCGCRGVPVEAARSAVPVLPPVRLSVPLAEPGVPVSEYRALHGLCRSGVVEAGPGVGDRVASVAVADGRHRLEVKQFDPVCRELSPPPVAVGEASADVLPLPCGSPGRCGAAGWCARPGWCASSAWSGPAVPDGLPGEGRLGRLVPGEVLVPMVPTSGPGAAGPCRHPLGPF